jgi:hypothetical protein
MVMKLITNFFGVMTVLTLLAIPLALFTDTSTGEYPYSVGDAFLGWIFFSVVFTLLRRRSR